VRKSAINSTPYAAAPRCRWRPKRTSLDRSAVNRAFNLPTPNTTYDARVASSQRSRTAVDDHAFLLPSDPVISGCDLIGGSPSCSNLSQPAMMAPDCVWCIRNGRESAGAASSSVSSRPCGPVRVFAHCTSSCSSQGPSHVWPLPQPRREGVPPSWARFPSWTGISSRAARDRCPRGGPPQKLLDQVGRRPAVVDAIPVSDGIIFPSTLGWVLMTAGYPLP
jgi:hypothetical protein